MKQFYSASEFALALKSRIYKSLNDVCQMLVRVFWFHKLDQNVAITCGSFDKLLVARG